MTPNFRILADRACVRPCVRPSHLSNFSFLWFSYVFYIKAIFIEHFRHKICVKFHTVSFESSFYLSVVCLCTFSFIFSSRNSVDVFFLTPILIFHMFLSRKCFCWLFVGSTFHFLADFVCFGYVSQIYFVFSSDWIWLPSDLKSDENRPLALKQIASILKSPQIRSKWSHIRPFRAGVS